MNGSIPVAVAALGAMMLLLLYLRIRAATESLTLRRHRATAAGFVDLLNYAALVDDGVIVCKNGALMAAWLYQGDDNANSTDEQRNAASVRINQALSGLGNGWMIHVDAVRRPAPEYPEPQRSHFPDPVSDAVDEERRRLFQGLGTMYEGYFVLTLTYFAPMLAERKFVELMFDDDAVAPDHKARTQGLIDHFNRECANIESRLSAALKLSRLRGHKVVREDGAKVTLDDFLRWLQFCATGLNHPVILPSNPMYLDCLIGAQELWTGVVPRIGRKFIQVVAVDGFPLESTPGILTALAEQPCEYRWSSRFIFMEPHEAAAHLEKYRKKWKQKTRGFFDQVFNTHTGAIDQDALSMVADAEAAIAEVNSGLVAQGYYTSVVVLMDDDREQLDQSARLIEKAINRLGFAARIETLNTLDAFLGSLPGHGVENVRRPLINTLNLADLLPTSTIWTGQNQAPCPMYPPAAPALMQCVTHGSTPFRLNLHVRDLGHTLMIGPTRSGKSTPAAILIDEAWLMLGHPVFREKIREWLKAFAKKNCLVLLSTQGLTDAANSGILDVIVESTATKIFLPNLHARDEDTAALYRRMGLNSRQIDIVAGAIPKRQYYSVSESGHRLYETALGPLALAFAGSTDKESIAAITGLEAKHGDEWVHRWLAIKGLRLDNYLGSSAAPVNDHEVTA